MEHEFEWYQYNPIIINEFDGIRLVKDLEHRFIACNHFFENVTGISIDDFIGKSDADMPWAGDRDIYINHENDILRGESYRVIEPLMLTGVSNMVLLTTKKIIHDKRGYVRGTDVFAKEVSVNNDFMYDLSGRIKFIKVTSYAKEFSLTSNEAIVLYLLIKGSHRSKITEFARISSRTYDRHLKSIKLKLEVESVQDILVKAYSNGWNSVFPLQCAFL